MSTSNTKSTAKKAVSAVKSAAKSTRKKTSKKKPVAMIQETFIEVNGDQINTEALVERIKQTYKDEGHRIGAIKSLRTYLNLSERRAYYVVNDKEEQRYIDF